MPRSARTILPYEGDVEGICKRNIKEEDKIKVRRETRKKAKSANV